MSQTTTQPRSITKAIPANPVAKWFHDNVYEVLKKALRVTIVDQPVDVNVINDNIGDPPLTEAIDGILSINTSTPILEAKVGANALVGRRGILIQPLNAHIWIGADNATVIGNGTKVFKYEKIWFPAEMPLYIARDIKDTDVYILEAK